MNGVIDCYDNEADYCIRVLLPFLATSLMSSCDQVACPSKTEMYKSHSISLGCDNNKASFHSSLSEWLHSRITTCQRKFSSKSSSDIPCQSDQTQNCDGTTSVSWHCAGIRTTYQRTFHCFQLIYWVGEANCKSVIYQQASSWMTSNLLFTVLHFGMAIIIYASLDTTIHGFSIMG